jgi:hypothetical protein
MRPETVISEVPMSNPQTELVPEIEPGCGYIRRHPGAVAPTLQRRHELLTYGEDVRAFSQSALTPDRPTFGGFVPPFSFDRRYPQQRRDDD